jgi:hypothetical protein
MGSNKRYPYPLGKAYGDDRIPVHPLHANNQRRKPRRVMQRTPDHATSEGIIARTATFDRKYLLRMSTGVRVHDPEARRFPRRRFPVMPVFADDKTPNSKRENLLVLSEKYRFWQKSWIGRSARRDGL